MALEGAFPSLGRAGVAKVTTANLGPKLKVSLEVAGEAEALVEPNLTLTSFGDGGFVGLHGAVAPGQQGPNVLRRRRRRKGPLEEPQRGRTHSQSSITRHSQLLLLGKKRKKKRVY